jgi:hypothetical protein
MSWQLVLEELARRDRGHPNSGLFDAAGESLFKRHEEFRSRGEGGGDDVRVFEEHRRVRSDCLFGW